MGLYESVIRPIAFRFDPEFVHHWAMRLIKAGLFSQAPLSDNRLSVNVAGIDFANPLGLAAGFDKDAEAVEAWQGLGFGYIEVGTVTPLPQPGNPRPRLFRLPSDCALINRMGFNNSGAEPMRQRLEVARPGLPVGVNIGKNKTTPLSEAPKDYAKSYRQLKDCGDYFVINVSSPNTPGLRELQDKDALVDIASAMQAIDATKPIFVKVAPDLELSALDDVIEVVHTRRLAGIVATNTTLSREGLVSDINQTGGLSGKPVRSLANRFISHLYSSCDKSVAIIGVGGIFDGDDLYQKIGLGANLCQTYTGFVYGGPMMVVRTLAELAARLERDNIASVAELRGALAV